MKRKRFLAVACAAAMIASMTTGLAVNVSAADEKSDFAGEELSILVSAGWMDNRYDETIKRFEDTYDVTVDLQTIPADQYSDLLQSKLATDSCADIFWIQSNPFAIESTIVDPEKYCIDFTGASWENVMPETRKESCILDLTAEFFQLIICCWYFPAVLFEQCLVVNHYILRRCVPDLKSVQFVIVYAGLFSYLRSM